MIYLWNTTVLPHGKCQEWIKTEKKSHYIRYIAWDTPEEAVLPQLYHTSGIQALRTFPKYPLQGCVWKLGEEKERNKQKPHKCSPKPPPNNTKTSSQSKATSFCKTGEVSRGSSLEPSAAKVATAPLRPTSRGNKSCPARDNSCWSNEQRWGSSTDYNTDARRLLLLKPAVYIVEMASAIGKFNERKIFNQRAGL